MPKMPPLSVDQKPVIRFKNKGKLKGKLNKEGRRKAIPKVTGEDKRAKLKAQAKKEAAESLAVLLSMEPETDTSEPRKGAKYQPQYVAMAEKAMKRGMTRLELADLFGVSPGTISKWSVQHEAFGKALKVGEDLATDRVEASLYQRAVGFEFEGEKLFYNKDLHRVHRATTREVVHPDVGAAQWWLKNKRPEEWRDRTESVNMNMSMEVAFDAFIRELQFNKGNSNPEIVTIEGEVSKPDAAE
jgi:hypothetical protein